MRLKEILRNIKTASEIADVEISNISNDSREIGADSLFIALSGYETDRHEYIGDAYSKGCRFFVVDERRRDEFEKKYPEGKFLGIASRGTKFCAPTIAKNFYGDPSSKIKLIGITGTNGKTTTAFAVYSILRKLGKSAGLIGTIEYRINDEIRPAINTTPDALHLNKLMAEMADKKVEYLVMEVSSHALSLGRVEGLNFDIAGFTNFTQDHLDYHKTMDEYFSAKLKIFDILAQSNKNPKVAIVNKDSDRFEEIFKHALLCRDVALQHLYAMPIRPYKVKTISLRDPSADYFAGDIKTAPDKSEFKINGDSAEIAMIGRPNIYNFTFASAIISELRANKPFAPTQDAIKKMRDIKVRGRMETVENNRGITVVIDYAHTPDGIENLLLTLRDVIEPDKKLISVFGCGGDRDKSKRPKMGKIAEKLSDFVIITSDNPRSEDPMSIIEDIEMGFDDNSCQYEVIADRAEAIKRALEKARSGDIIAIAGKGHEDYQIIGKEKLHFSDKEIVAQGGTVPRGQSR